jgi:hypothetical protein
MYQKHVSLYYRSKKNIYTNGTGSLTFNRETFEAFSYRWWKFVAKVEGKIVFNNYRYSVSTSKHQNKIRNLLNELKIKIDIELPLPKGINSSSLQDLFETAEEHLCDAFLAAELKRQDRNERAKIKRFEKKLEHYLENVVHFRDYEIKPKSQFGRYNKIAVHQVVEDIENDVSNALHSFHRDGFGNVVFYVGV